MPKKVYKKKAPYKKKPKARRMRRRRAIPSSVGLLGMPSVKRIKVSTNAIFYAAIATPQNAYFDVCVNDLHQPWFQTFAYNTPTFFVSSGTPTPATNGFPGLAQLIGTSGSQFYLNYRITSANLSVSMQAANDVDIGNFTLSPYTIYNGANDGLPSNVYQAMDDPGSKWSRFDDDKPYTCSMRVNMAKLFGVPYSVIKGDHQYGAYANTSPVNQAFVRVYIAKGDAGALAGNLMIKAKLTLSGYLFNESGTKASTVIS